VPGASDSLKFPQILDSSEQIASFFGPISTGIFAQKFVNGISGLIEGNWHQFGEQAY
jgi:ammonia channel protein AmtB